MQKEELFEQNNSQGESQEKKLQPKKRQHIKKDNRKKDKRKKDSHRNETQQQIQLPQKNTQQAPSYKNIQSQISKYQMIQDFWRSDIQFHYKTQITEDDKNALKVLLNQKPPELVQILKNRQTKVLTQKISLQYFNHYCMLVGQLNSLDCTFVSVQNSQRKQFFVLQLDQDSNINKAIQVTQQELRLLAKRQQAIKLIQNKIDAYNKKMHKNQKLNQIEVQIAFLNNYTASIKQQLNQKLAIIYEKALEQPKYTPPIKVEEHYITFLIKKNLRKALQNDEIDYFNHFKKLDINENVSAIVDLKPITDKKEYQQYIRKRKLKKSGKKARGILKTACGGCLSYFHQLYNPFFFCSQCHIRYHKYCYIPKNDGICDSCYLLKNNQTKKSRINECQLCGIKGLLYLPMNESSNAHIFCLLINNLWKFQSTQIIFSPKHNANAIQNIPCSLCSNFNACIYKCQCCTNAAHPLCAYFNGWEMKLDGEKGKEGLMMKCCDESRRKLNQRKRTFVFNYKKKVFTECE